MDSSNLIKKYMWNMNYLTATSPTKTIAVKRTLTSLTLKVIMFLKVVLLVFVVIINLKWVISVETEEDHGVKYANRCEVCKILATELESRLDETGKTSEALELGYAVDDVKPKKKKEYKKSELRLVESLEGVCDRILEYNIHKEREDSTRFAKGMSQTFKTLHGLVDKGVKVELGIPYELWDKPSAEVTNMKTQCETLLEENEADIEDWYFHHQTESLKKYLCEDRALKGNDLKCLYEHLKGETGSNRPADASLKSDRDEF